jgi:hypothetical protein
VEDWREVIIELEILPRWPFSRNPKEAIMFVEHNMDGVIMKYSRVDYMVAMGHAVKLIENFYDKFRPLLRNITVNNMAMPCPAMTPQIRHPLPPKRPRFPT